jgi:hypothetical protein
MKSHDHPHQEVAAGRWSFEEPLSITYDMTELAALQGLCCITSHTSDLCSSHAFVAVEIDVGEEGRAQLPS